MKDKVQIVCDRGIATVTINVPGFMQFAVNVEDFNEMAYKAWGQEGVLKRINDRVRINTDDLSDLFYVLASRFGDLTCFIQSDDDRLKFKIKDPDSFLAYVIVRVYGAQKKEEEKDQVSKADEAISWSFKGWALSEAGCFGDRIYTSGGVELGNVPEYTSYEVGDRVAITSDQDKLALFSVPVRVAGKSGVVDRLTWGTWVRVKLSGDSHVYVPVTLVKMAHRSKKITAV